MKVKTKESYIIFSLLKKENSTEKLDIDKFQIIEYLF